jgi:hypothetical protein
MRAAVVFAQIGAAVLLFGYALFRYLMARAALRPGAPGPDEVEGGLRAFRWPGSGAGLSLTVLGWAFVAALLGSHALRILMDAPTIGVGPSVILGAVVVAGHHVFLSRPSRSAALVFLLIVVLAGVGLIAPRPFGGLYSVSLGIHIAAAGLWLGHMFFWSVFSGPGLKRLPDRELGARLRDLSLSGPGLGWPALVVLSLTGLHLILTRGIGFDTLFSPEFAGGGFGLFLNVKLGLVLAMVGYQAVFGHREAPRAILVNMVIALAVLALAALMTGV